MAIFSSNVWGALVTSGAFWLVFVAFNTAQGLATTIMDPDVANASLAGLYACFTLLCIVTPKLVECTGPKFAMLLGAIPYCLLVFSYIIKLSGSARLPLAMPVFALVGISASMLWTGQGIYLGRAAVREATATHVQVEKVTSRLNGIFWAVFQSTGLIGLALASLVQLAFGKANFEEANQYLFLGLGVASACGVFVFTFLPPQPPMTEAEKLVEVGETAGLTAGPESPLDSGDLDGLRDRASGSCSRRSGAAVDDSSAGGRAAKHTHEDDGDHAGAVVNEPTGGATLMSTLELMCKRRQMLMMLPLIIYNGLSLGWFFAAFPVFYAPGEGKGRALLPSDMVGFVQGTFYLSNAILSLVFGILASRCGRRPVFYTAAVAAISFLSVMLYLQGSDALPQCQGDTCSPVSYVVVFFLSFLFAVGDSVFESQLPAVLQSTTFFETEAERDAAQGNLRMWQSFGFAVQLAMNIFVKDDQIRLSVLLGWFVFAIVCALSTDACVKPFDAQADEKSSISVEGSEHLLA